MLKSYLSVRIKLLQAAVVIYKGLQILLIRPLLDTECLEKWWDIPAQTNRSLVKTEGQMLTKLSRKYSRSLRKG